MHWLNFTFFHQNKQQGMTGVISNRMVYRNRRIEGITTEICQLTDNGFSLQLLDASWGSRLIVDAKYEDTAIGIVGEC